MEEELILWTGVLLWQDKSPVSEFSQSPELFGESSKLLSLGGCDLQKKEGIEELEEFEGLGLCGRSFFTPGRLSNLLMSVLISGPLSSTSSLEEH